MALGAITASLLAPLSSAFAGEQQSFCGSPSQFTVPSDLANVEGDLTLEHIAQLPASMTVCAYGYFAEKCGDHVTANVIYDKCIAAGYVGAMICKGLLYEDSNGVEQDSGKAAALFKRAALSGNSAYATLGKVHYASALQLGKGVPRDEKEALKWFQATADEGDTDAQTFLRTGKPIPPSRWPISKQLPSSAWSLSGSTRTSPRCSGWSPPCPPWAGPQGTA